MTEGGTGAWVAGGIGADGGTAIGRTDIKVGGEVGVELPEAKAVGKLQNCWSLLTTVGITEKTDNSQDDYVSE